MIPCSFVYANGKLCSGYITRVEAYKADISWEQSPNGEWTIDWQPRSHYHLFCSERGNHVGYKRMDDRRMKAHWGDLPKDLRSILDSTGVRAAESGP